jgi:hypothetical protein
METELDHELAAADPAAAAPTSDMRNALFDLIEATERSSQTRPRRLASTAAAATAVAVFGGAGAAAAGLPAWDGPGWWGNPDATTQRVTDGSGSTCRVTYAPRTLHVPDHPVAPAERAAAMAAATDFLSAFDYATVQHLPPGAAFEELNTQLSRALAEQGFSTYAVSVAVATDCDSRSMR